MGVDRSLCILHYGLGDVVVWSIQDGSFCVDRSCYLKLRMRTVLDLALV